MPCTTILTRIHAILTNQSIRWHRESRTLIIGLWFDDDHCTWIYVPITAPNQPEE